MSIFKLPSIGVASTCIASAFMARTTGFLIYEASALPTIRMIALPSRFRLHLRESFRYEYDFTANWRVDIRLEKIRSADGRRIRPICSGGLRADPATNTLSR
jgi:Plasmid pRiA4b ORF-3-like protein